MSKQPNFLMFINDQHRADHLGCYGNKIVQTPNIDGIAANGTKFDKFYVSTPICMPNRATLMTGRMPSLHGVRQNGIPLPLNQTTFTQLLRAAGYYTALFGKSHLQCISSNPVEVGLPVLDPNKVQPPTDLTEAQRDMWLDGDYEQELPTTWQEDPNFEPELPFYGFDEVSLAIGHSDRVTGHYSRWLAERHPDPDSLRGPKNALPSNREIKAPQAWRTKASNCSDVGTFQSPKPLPNRCVATRSVPTRRINSRKPGSSSMPSIMCVTLQRIRVANRMAATSDFKATCK